MNVSLCVYGVAPDILNPGFKRSYIVFRSRSENDFYRNSFICANYHLDAIEIPLFA